MAREGREKRSIVSPKSRTRITNVPGCKVTPKYSETACRLLTISCLLTFLCFFSNIQHIVGAPLQLISCRTLFLAFSVLARVRDRERVGSQWFDPPFPLLSCRALPDPGSRLAKCVMGEDISLFFVFLFGVREESERRSGMRQSVYQTFAMSGNCQCVREEEIHLVKCTTNPM